MICNSLSHQRLFLQGQSESKHGIEGRLTSHSDSYDKIAISKEDKTKNPFHGNGEFVFCYQLC